jgi:membrane-associated protein
VTAISVIIVSAILGGIAGYYIGHKAGPKLFTKKDGLFFRHEYIQKAEEFYEKHGGKTIALARFVPVVRTFAPVVAGIGSMNVGKFMFYNVIGSVVWGASITLAAYYLGSKFPIIVNNIEYVFLLAIPFILGPPLYHLYSNYKKNK